MKHFYAVVVGCIVLLGLSIDFSRVLGQQVQRQGGGNESQPQAMTIASHEATPQAADPAPVEDATPASGVPLLPAAQVERRTSGTHILLDYLLATDTWRGHWANQQRLHGSAPPARLIPTQTAPLLAPAWRYSIRRIEPFGQRKVVALTFDLCERTGGVSGYDAPIIDYLRATKVSATFFAGGKWMRSHPEQTMQLMADPLFEVGNHSWTHDNLRLLHGKELETQILWAQAQYELLWEELASRAQRIGLDPQEMAGIPKRPLTFRFPYGACSAEALQTLANYGLPAIQWDVVSGDPAPQQTADGIVQNVLHHTRPGSIVVFHANGREHGTADALPRLIPALQARGFTFVTVSELLQLGTVTASEECYELRPGDNRRYDTFSGSRTNAWR